MREATAKKDTPLVAVPADAAGFDQIVTDDQTPGPDPVEAAATPKRRVRVQGPGLQAKIILLMASALVVLALISAFATSAALQSRMQAEARSKGEAVVRGLASSVGLLLSAGEPRAISSLFDRFEAIEGVAYLVVYDAAGEVLASSYPGPVPEPLAAPAESDGEGLLMVPLPGGSASASVLDLTSSLGASGATVRVGMDLDATLAGVRELNVNLLVIQGLVALVAILFSVLFSARLVRPIRSLVRLARNVGQGDLSRTARVTSSDEVGRLTWTFNEMVRRLRDLVVTEEERDEERRRRENLQRNIREFLQVAMEVSAGDLRQRGKVTEDVLGSVVDSINVMVEEIGETLRGVQEAAHIVQLSADQVIGATDDIGVGVESQLQAAQSVSADVAEVSESVREVSSSAESSAGAARQTLDAARRGRQAVGDTLSSMQRIRAEVQGIARRIKALGDRSLEISEIVETIGGISSQTNLLALNAAIEASGAGEQGARFAVVAGEVRKLAEESASASQRIAGLIKAVQSEIQEAVAAMEEGTSEVETGFRVAQQAGERLEEIATISDTSNQLAEGISSRATSQVEKMQLVAKGVSSMAQLAKQSDITVAGGRSAADQLRQLAEQLNRRLKRFQIPGATS